MDAVTPAWDALAGADAVAPWHGDTVLGIDGCRAGWFGVVLAAGRAPDWCLAPTLAALLERWSGARCLIDIPIGLPHAQPRAVEGMARALLGRPRAASVFAVPTRAAVYAPDYAQACYRNRERVGAALSRQAWNLVPKIREADRLLQRRREWRPRLLEAHPELCFAALAGGRPMAYRKKDAAGEAERMRLLGGCLDGAEALLARATAATRRRDVARDDVVDALCLAVSARLPLARIPPRADGFGFTMVFPRL